jgi:hypothetical protein
MNQEKFLKAVANRANEIVQDRIAAFYGQINTALRNLNGGSGADFNWKRGQELLACLLQENIHVNNPRKWPNWLWREEEERVTKQLFEMMDPIARALSARDPKPEDEQPKDEDKKDA